MDAKKFNFTIDGAPFIVAAEPSQFNSELRYTVTVNNDTTVMFAFDKELGRYAPIGDEAINIPDDLELAIGSRLNGESLTQQ